MYQPKTISQKEMVADGKYLVYGANGVIGRYDKFNHEEPELLITCRGATCGSVNISQPMSWINGNAMVVRPIDKTSLDLRYLEYIFRGGVDVSKAITGSAQPQITRTSLEPIEISYPKSLPEQQRIVSVLDGAFASIAQAKSNAERNLVNARELFETVVAEIFNGGEDWEEKLLGEVCSEIFAGGDVPKDRLSKTKTAKYTIPIFANGEKNKGLYGYTNLARVTVPSVTVSARGTIGYSEIREEPFYPAVRLIVIIPNLDILDLSFLQFAIKNIDFKHSGVSIPQLTVPMIKEYSIPLPPLAEQRAIVGRLEALSAETGRLEEIYQSKVDALDELKRSVLQRAFEGNL